MGNNTRALKKLLQEFDAQVAKLQQFAGVMRSYKHHFDRQAEVVNVVRERVAEINIEIAGESQGGPYLLVDQARTGRLFKNYYLMAREKVTLVLAFFPVGSAVGPTYEVDLAAYVSVIALRGVYTGTDREEAFATFEALIAGSNFGDVFDTDVPLTDVGLSLVYRAAVVNAITLDYGRAIEFLQERALPLTITNRADRVFRHESDDEPPEGDANDVPEDRNHVVMGAHAARMRSCSEDTGGDATDASGLLSLADAAEKNAAGEDELENSDVDVGDDPIPEGVFVVVPEDGVGAGAAVAGTTLETHIQQNQN